MKNKKVVLGLSGGVDSTTAALLLQEKGYEVIGLYFDAMGKGREDAGAVRAEMAAKQLGIKFLYRDVSDIFREKVIGNFCSEYVCGRTPNPCIVCNPDVKFKTLLAAADEVGADWIATGHYAGTYQDPESEEWFIRRAKSEAKDQSYMLYRLTQQQLSMLLLPLEGLEKTQVRQSAHQLGLACADAPDSQEICWLPDGDYASFIEQKLGSCPAGEFISPDGTVCGQHKGLLHYTVGQRKHLGVALGYPVFIRSIDPQSNRIYLARTGEEYAQGVLLRDCVIQPNPLLALHQPARAQVKVRSRAPDAPATITLLPDGCAHVLFDTPQRAPAPGQSCVIYDGDIVLGGGFIEKQLLSEA